MSDTTPDSSADSHPAKDSGSPAQPVAPSRFVPLRVWPAAVLVGLMVVLRSLPRLVEELPPNVWMICVMGPLVAGFLILIWWLAASRATWKERLLGAAGVIAAAAVMILLADSTMHGPATVFYTLPLGLGGFGLALVLTGRMLSFRRTVIALLVSTCGFGITTLFRNEGMTGDFKMGFHWRWNPTPEEAFLAEKGTGPVTGAQSGIKPEWREALAHPDWPGYRGADRAGIQHGPAIDTHWAAHPPRQLWSISAGPAWSSFAVAGGLLFTQEQRGANDTVVCYEADSGREVWTRSVESRFDDPMGGPGPRATPTLSDGGLFVQGAQGWLMRLDPATGEVRWQVDLREAAERQPPMWGFSSSPLVVGGVVVVHAGGAGNRGILAFDAGDGKLRWSAAAGDHSYSSPQLSTIEGEETILMLTNAGLDFLDPATGSVKFTYEWKIDNYRALQPQVIGGGGILVPTPMGLGTRLIRVSKAGGNFAAEDVWTSRDLKPDFNDFVVYQGHAYGFDGGIFACVDLETGRRAWKGGRYGKGQVLLLADAGLLLVVSERGEVFLLEANPEAHTELGSFPALDGKTWNHPVLVGDRLYLRNAQQIACYQLSLAAPASQ